MILFGNLANGNLVAISEADSDWTAVCEALDQSGRLSLSMDNAKLQLLADSARKPLSLLGDVQGGKSSNGFS
jgi:hypothetical protein